MTHTVAVPNLGTIVFNRSEYENYWKSLSESDRALLVKTNYREVNMLDISKNIVYENAIGYVWRENAKTFEVRVNQGTYTVGVGAKKTLEHAKTTLDRLAKYPKALNLYLRN